MTIKEKTICSNFEVIFYITEKQSFGEDIPNISSQIITIIFDF